MPRTKSWTKTLGLPHFPRHSVHFMVHLFYPWCWSFRWMGQVRVTLCVQPRVFNFLGYRPKPHIHGNLWSRHIHHRCSWQVLRGKPFQWRGIGIVVGEHGGRWHCCWYLGIWQKSPWQSTWKRKKWWWNMIITVIIKPLIINLLLFIKMGKKGGKSKGKPVVMT